ncbi:BTB/POZ and MATH domain-containing protein 3-like [Brachypodium distachyon]|uniref:BTB/POZ and MATH domain-containing protein 3-like n=1 Tax=Brachypodium distachyon TaxID=15368 RepID=UPI000D0CE156|nr:BTB/POZ and MATH domain-containing protein 3-like [Brachypodium distachyon]|eukprot:XP_024317160.1 BTB/POZ and MATH domain-containing protein 3-like [Brachypodium distachyon]
MLEQSGCIVGDCLKIHCALIVTKEPPVIKVIYCGNVHLPPSSIIEKLQKLLETQESCDICSSREEFPAHKLVMAMQSPVFKADIYGTMMEKDITRTVVPDMQPSVFRALLHFIYTDSPPLLGNLDGSNRKEMIKHLLVAADRYAMERQKLLCEISLRKVLDVKTMMNMLDLAD